MDHRCLGIPRRDGLPDYLPVRMVNEFVYCPRLFFYSTNWVGGKLPPAEVLKAQKVGLAYRRSTTLGDNVPVIWLRVAPAMICRLKLPVHPAVTSPLTPRSFSR